MNLHPNRKASEPRNVNGVNGRRARSWLGAVATALLSAALLTGVTAAPTTGCFFCGECGAPAPSVYLTLVDDATGLPVEGMASFSTSPYQSAYWGCSQTVDAGVPEAGVSDAGVPTCVTWSAFLLDRVDVTINAPGYRPLTVTVEPGRTTGCCADAARQVRQTVRLQRP